MSQELSAAAGTENRVGTLARYGEWIWRVAILAFGAFSALGLKNFAAATRVAPTTPNEWALLGAAFPEAALFSVVCLLVVFRSHGRLLRSGLSDLRALGVLIQLLRLLAIVAAGSFLVVAYAQVLHMKTVLYAVSKTQFAVLGVCVVVCSAGLIWAFQREPSADALPAE